jgi:hypothetical protein
MSLNLVESSKIALGRDKVLKSTVMELYAKSSDLLATMPFENITGNAFTYDREEVLPGVEFRGINEAYTESTGKVAQITERLCIAGGDIDVDTFIIKTSGMDQRAVQETMKIKALALKITKNLIKGSVLTDIKSFDGLQVKLTGDNLISMGSTSGGDVLTLTKLDELIDSVEDATHLLMNKGLRRRLSGAARSASVGGYITYDVDAFGRKVTKYNDLPILIAFKDETNTEILPFSESGAGGGTAQCTSLYCLSFSDNGVQGLQNDDMDVRDLGEVQDKPVYRTRIEWFITLALLRVRCASRLYGIKDGAVTA